MTNVRVDRNQRLFNTAILLNHKFKLVDARRPAPMSHLVDGRPWWAVAPRNGLTRIARERMAGR